MSEKIIIGYFGDGVWAHNAFRKIVNDAKFKIAFVVLRYDSSDEVLATLAKEQNIPILKEKNINNPEFLDRLKNYNCDIFVSMSFDQIFKSEIINIPPLKTINCHAGKLPFYRGRNILNWALINDEKDFGITVHYMDTGIDTGDIILQKTYPISDNDNYASLLETAHIECASVLYEAFVRFIAELLNAQNKKGAGFIAQSVKKAMK
ncbi:formyltransferase family protein [Campylobacter sp.]|uniref:formyltransferase family protein n=1 Tax=Campylobacter sp. TaxID=205 RepID=UPI002A7FB784|nr:formyltransferase family protein [Campylobacter sp.]MDY4803842.1 formyltransferase family protein [Campylobacter sp.]